MSEKSALAGGKMCLFHDMCLADDSEGQPGAEQEQFHLIRGGQGGCQFGKDLWTVIWVLLAQLCQPAGGLGVFLPVDVQDNLVYFFGIGGAFDVGFLRGNV